MEYIKLDSVVLVKLSNSMPMILKTLFKLKRVQKPSVVFTEWDEFILNQKAFIFSNSDKSGLHALIEYTGGTTGEPKGVVLSNLNVNAVTDQYRRSGVPFSRGNIWQSVSAPFIAYAWIISMHCPLSFGIQCKITVYDPKTIAEKTIKIKYNHVAANPLVWETIIHSPKAKRKNFSYLIAPTTGADYMSQQLEEKINRFLLEHHCKWKICQGYGMTELGSAVSVNINNKINKMGSVGIPFVNTTITIFDTETETELEYGKIGEVCVSGPSVMEGYFNNAEATKRMIRKHANGKGY